MKKFFGEFFAVLGGFFSFLVEFVSAAFVFIALALIAGFLFAIGMVAGIDVICEHMPEAHKMTFLIKGC